MKQVEVIVTKNLKDESLDFFDVDDKIEFREEYGCYASHTNSLVEMYFSGALQEVIESMIDEKDKPQRFIITVEKI